MCQRSARAARLPAVGALHAAVVERRHVVLSRLGEPELAKLTQMCIGAMWRVIGERLVRHLGGGSIKAVADRRRWRPARAMRPSD
jgi:hypothetical protein